MTSTNQIDSRILDLWEELEATLAPSTGTHERVYRRLDLQTETGIRLGCVVPGIVWELLIEIGDAGDKGLFTYPKWRGMEFETVTLDVPMQNTQHIRLYLDHRENKDIFVTVCADLIRSLNGCLTNEIRKDEIASFLARWSAFFEKHGQEGLSLEKQQGLYGELWWLRKMLQEGIEPAVAVNSWKGCRRNYHDFETNGNAVEVKTTMSKEPRKIQINNERQLNERGLKSLFLFVLTLGTSDIGETLSELVDFLGHCFSGKPAAYTFENSLREAGYLVIHRNIYTRNYTTISDEMFCVREAFPRITIIPQGLGDLHYTLVLAACRPFECKYSDIVNRIKGLNP